MSGEPNRPLQSKESKKRELSSPEFDICNKKNRILSDLWSESDISGLGTDTIASNMTTTNLPSSNPSSQLTLRDEDLQKIASYMKESFHTQVAEITQASLQQSVSELVNSIVSGVLSGPNFRIASLENENRQLQQRIQQMETAAGNAEQYSRRNLLRAKFRTKSTVFSTSVSWIPDLRISGIQETDVENTVDSVLNLARSIDVELSLGDIDRSHRLGRPGNATGDTPRNIIVKVPGEILESAGAYQKPWL